MHDRLYYDNDRWPQPLKIKRRMYKNADIVVRNARKSIFFIVFSQNILLMTRFHGGIMKIKTLYSLNMLVT